MFDPIKHFPLNEDGSFWASFGGSLRTLGPSGSSDVGQELDLTLVYKRDRHSTSLAGYSHFFAGEFLEDTSPGEDVDFVYLQFQYTF